MKKVSEFLSKQGAQALHYFHGIRNAYKPDQKCTQTTLAVTIHTVIQRMQDTLRLCIRHLRNAVCCKLMRKETFMKRRVVCAATRCLRGCIWRVEAPGDTLVVDRWPQFKSFSFAEQTQGLLNAPQRKVILQTPLT